MLHKGYSAKEKRQDGPPPSCECHDRPMRWNRRADLVAGGYWRCNLRYAEGQRRWREANRENRTRYMAAWRERNPRHRAAYMREYRYGIRAADYEALFASQNGRCAICDIPMTDAPKGALHVDHDHATDRVRGLLCLRCNTAIERVEIPGWIDRATAYLR